MNTEVQNEPAIFLRISEAARLLSMSRTSAYHAMRRGVLPAIRIDGKWRIPRAALLNLATQALTDTTAVAED